MKENTWQNIRTQQYYGSNTVLGSPRGWVQRALGQKTDLFLHPTSLDPRSLSVAGIWPRGHALPDTGSAPAIYRYFRITDDIRRISRARAEDFYPVTGMAVAVSWPEVLPCLRLFSQTALWVWMNRPGAVPPPQRAPGQNRVALDHQLLYDRFESGARPQELFEELGSTLNSVIYVYNKWRDGHPASRKPRKIVDHQAVQQDLRQGISVPELVKKYDVSRTMIYKIRSQICE